MDETVSMQNVCGERDGVDRCDEIIFLIRFGYKHVCILYSSYNPLGANEIHSFVLSLHDNPTTRLRLVSGHPGGDFRVGPSGFDPDSAIRPLARVSCSLSVSVG